MKRLITISLGLLVAISVFAFPTPFAYWKNPPVVASGGVSTANLVAYYKADNGNDSSGNSHTLTAQDGASSGTAGGIIGNCFSFTAASSQYFTTASINPLSGATGLTVACWMKSSSFSGKQNLIAQANLSAASTTVFCLRVNDNTDILWDVSNGTSLSGITPVVSTLSTATWYFIVGTWTSGTVTLYVNAVSAGTSSSGIATSLNTASQIIYVGTEGRLQDFMSGNIDEAFIYARALSLGEIQTLYNSGAAARPNGI